MPMMRMSLLVCAVVCALPARRAQACTMPEAGIYALYLTFGVPDAQGNINGQPNPNVVAEGDDILLTSGCSDCTGITQTVVLTDATNQKLATTLDPIEPGLLLRLHPQQPLAAGKYTLKTTFITPNGNPGGNVLTYVFKVQGTRSTTPLEFDIGLSSEVDTAGVNAGTTLTCKEMDSCGRNTQVWTQWLPRVDIAAIHNEQPAPAAAQAFLYRLLPSDDPKAADLINWSFASVAGFDLRVSSIEQKPEYCVELQALRVADLTVMSLAKQCVKYTLPSPPYDPVPFNPNCTRDEPEEYARAWCSDNQAACSASNPHAEHELVKSACPVYPSLCAAFLGNRTEDLVCK